MSIIRDPLYIAEDYRLNESLIEFESSSLASDLERIDQSAVVALVGDYGTGKSTALYGVQQVDQDEQHKWLQFDAWRYPERKGLWDGLVIEVAKQLGQDKKVVRRVDGNKSMLGRWGGIVGEIFSQFGDNLPKLEADKLGEVDPKAAGKVAAITGKAEAIFGKSPVKRVYELERIFADILVSIDAETIYIVVEDVDRSGSDGLHFLETLNFFIKNNEQVAKSDKKIIVIAPIATANYLESKDSYYKCVDVALDFAPQIKSAKEFIEKVLSDEALGGASHPFLENIEAFTIGLFDSNIYKMNIRKLKAIIRQTNLRYESMRQQFNNVDWRGVFVFETMRNIPAGDGSTKTLFDQTIKGHSQTNSQNIFTGLLMTIQDPQQPIYIYKYANRHLPEDRQFNPRIASYKFLEYNPQSHGDTSVWIGRGEDGMSMRGYIAEYYRK